MSATDIRRTKCRSPRFPVEEADIGYFMNYTGFVPASDGGNEGQRMLTSQIDRKALAMIERATKHIVLSVFLFDSFYADAGPSRDVVGTLTAAFLRKRKKIPSIRIAVILDPSHKAYGRRESRAERLFRENGIDVFYSDLLVGLKKGSFIGVRESMGHINRVIDTVTFHGWGYLWSGLFSRAKLPARFDGDVLTLESAYNAFLLKANHRKLLVTDVGGEEYEVLVTSANPHNASAFHINSAISVKGAPARYVFNVLREDMKKSASLGRHYAHWCISATRAYRRSYFTERFPQLDMQSRSTRTCAASVNTPVVTIVTEGRIPEAVLEHLGNVGEGDEIRIQMFYLSFKPVLKAILSASRRTGKPVRLLLDANKDSFNRERDGTPNRQAARYLLERSKAGGGQIEVRWYSTHGEQNHAKTMSITNPDTGKYIITTGSCNWTGRNLDNVNMEANVFVEGAKNVVAKFNSQFDAFWTNRDDIEYSVSYDSFGRQTGSNAKWIFGEKPFYYSTF